MFRSFPFRKILLISLLVLISTSQANPVFAGINIWTSIGPEGGDIRTLAINPATPTTLYAGTGGDVYKSANSGETWRSVRTGLPYTGVGFILAIDPVVPSTLYAGGAGMYKSTNGGENWNPASEGLPANTITALTIDPVVSTTLYAGTWGRGIYKSTNSGDSWSAVNTGLPLPHFMIQTLAIDPTASTTLYLGTWAGVFKSTNGGGNWNLASTGLPDDISVDVLAIDPVVPTSLYAGPKVLGDGQMDAGAGRPVYPRRQGNG